MSIAAKSGIATKMGCKKSWHRCVASVRDVRGQHARRMRRMHRAMARFHYKPWF